jgi:hypothetical protein
MKTDVIRDINALRCDVKTMITKVRRAIPKKHTWRGNKNLIYNYDKDIETKNRDT